MFEFSVYRIQSIYTALWTIGDRTDFRQIFIIIIIIVVIVVIVIVVVVVIIIIIIIIYYGVIV